MQLENGRALRLALAGVLAVLALNGAVNVALDGPTSWRTPHVVFEVLSIVVAMAAAAFLWLGWREAERTVRAVQLSLIRHQIERDAWKESARRALEGLGAAIDAQFGEWQLTPTEREIALLLLKGNSHKHIAELTGRRERTVRQHAVEVYQKSGLGGRAELAAFFLEDLLLPSAERDRLTPSS